ncbi:MAG: TIGR04100 family radical SAM protein [Oscillospiraceae bacterium]|nr:TIGR04100 family radical SAM protein [Oscillospiraceae bacterium]
MKKRMTILYDVGGKLYINLTNKCPCNCTFCIRHNGDGAYGSDSLWLEHEPSLDEVKAAFAKVDMSKYKEVVFCGYGEPMERVNEVIAVGEFVKANYGDVTVRLNTNGLGDKIHGVPTAKLLQGAVDIVSISLNSYCKEKYNEVTRPKWDDAFDAMLSFAADCKSYLPQVVFTVVDVIPPEDISRAKALAMSIGIPLRVREYES